MKHLVTFFIFLFLFAETLFSQQKCKVSNNAFADGELLEYVISYNWGFLWTDVGAATLSVKSDTINGVPLYMAEMLGTTFKSWDWVYRIRYKYRSWMDPENCKPSKFTRKSEEGDWRLDLTYIFDRRVNLAYTNFKWGKSARRMDTINISPYTFDLLSSLYMARNIDYSKCKVNDTINVNLLIDNKIEHLFFRYRGKEVFEMKNGEKYNSIKFTVQLLKNGQFEGGEKLTVWVSDDKNRIPLWIETPIVVGDIMVRLIGSHGLKNVETSKIK